jgi:hypothetical protein
LARRWGRAALAAALLVLPGVACSNILGIDADRHLATSDVDATGPDANPGAPEASHGGDGDLDGGAEVGPWDCLDLMPPNPDPSAHVTVTLIAYSAVDPFSSTADGGSQLIPVRYTPLVGVSARACPDLLDPTCAAGTPWTTTDDAGAVALTVGADFAGLYEVNRPDLIPMTAYPGRLLIGPSAQQVAVSMMNQQTAALIGTELGVKLDLGADSGVGMIFIGAFDCFDHRASGVTFSLSNPGADTLVFYLQNGFPSTTARATDQGLGGGGAINVPLGATTVTASVFPGRQIGTENVVIQPGGIVQMNFRPRFR